MRGRSQGARSAEFQLDADSDHWRKMPRFRIPVCRPWRYAATVAGGKIRMLLLGIADDPEGPWRSGSAPRRHRPRPVSDRDYDPLRKLPAMTGQQDDQRDGQRDAGR